MKLVQLRNLFVIIAILNFTSCIAPKGMSSDIIGASSDGSNKPYIPSSEEVRGYIEPEPSDYVESSPEIEGEPGGTEVCQGILVDEKGKELVMPKISPKGWKDEWSKKVVSVLETKKEISDSMLKDSDLINKKSLSKLGCNGYKFATPNERKRFWITFIAAMTYAESGLNAKTTYKEKNGTTSAGLLQIDYHNANAYCSEARSMGRKFTHKDMLDADLNLECGIHILQQQLTARRPRAIRKQGKGNLFVERSWGDSSNWSVLKLGLGGNTKVINQFKKHLPQLPFCSRTEALPRKLSSEDCHDGKDVCVSDIVVGEMKSRCLEINDSKMVKVNEAVEDSSSAAQDSAKNIQK